ncbi:bifunctional phosphoribosylaminoimidazolecarboxamide formyltransferase/IMP cyclohydrolase [Kribbella sp. VKM Ac-2568]|uniref:bifunctional phosphoribosylaminoimidazolecarboxamide formyltransferase/IMP cyclohydrolase n=1 Tax=Kribbella sp. VKM Ac-2568 TaxID=2512219 RepID=UPI0010478013|nr:bifunctional phosphoribosylaminoimidazolecarboxamide formyltransferase/IMP cyclohydrolase [Kribbella sp. VKM Ac-2568]TCM46709.1 phosphoribosylaminoimidazolecarboxamide formyltransferase/IMP cyclohydrolase [Kribbella sp. VKM Ac-2568]
MSTDRRPIRRALISVYDKTGLEELAKALSDAGVQLVSTGSTAARIAAAGVPVTKVEELTGFPECLDGRVKTLHPKVHAGLLADVRQPTHVEQLAEMRVEPFDLLVSNLYPFTETVASGASTDECIEQIDIGGPSMVRGAAKNHANVAVVVSPSRYDEILAALAEGGFSLEQRQRLAAEAFVHTASYDVAVASWMGSVLTDTSEGTGFPAWAGATWEKSAVLRYGENPHQPAALYVNGRGGLASAEQLHGKEMSYNNYVDADAARRTAYDFSEPAVAIIKHANPCGIAVGKDIAEAHRRAHECDPVSAYGGVIATNAPVSVEMAKQVAEIFTEVLVAPAFEDGAVEILQGKKNIRLLVAEPLSRGDAVETRAISGGLLMQHADRFQAPGDDPSAWQLAAGPAASAEVLADLTFAWKACRAVKSNAILLASDGASVGVGMGQVNRVDSCRLAVSRAGDRAPGSAAASDAFFPFPDGLEVLIEAGVKAVVQPGGSIRDDQAIEAATKAGITMYFTNTRHFFH